MLGSDNSSIVDRDSRDAANNAKENSSGDGSSFLQKSEFIDPLVRITKMKFLTSADIQIAN